MSRVPVTIIDAIADKHLFAPWFKDCATWQSWFAFLAALFALPMTPDQLAIYKECTGRSEPPTTQATEGWLICGRRGGKSFMLALVAVFLACFHDYRNYLSRGERGTVVVIAVDRKQARVILRYIKGLLTGVPMLARMIERETTESFDLTNWITIEVHSASFRTTRGYSVVAGLLDELAYFLGEASSDPDTEIINALRPGMSTIPNAMLLCASSPYARRGALWTAHRKHHGRDGDPILVWQAPTRTMNPSVPQSVIDRAMQDDPAAAASEYMAEFRSDIENYVAREAVECCLGDYFELPPLSQHRYSAFCDPSGGSADSFTLAISHKDGERIVVDCIRETRPPFSPEQVIHDYSALLQSYRVSKIIADKYAGEFPKELFRKRGIVYESSAAPKSDLYRDLLPMLNSGQITLPKSDRLVAQLTGLERRTARSGRDSIDHFPGAHDDIANSVAGVASIASVVIPQASWGRMRGMW